MAGKVSRSGTLRIAIIVGGALASILLFQNCGPGMTANDSTTNSSTSTPNPSPTPAPAPAPLVCPYKTNPIPEITGFDVSSTSIVVGMGRDAGDVAAKSVQMTYNSGDSNSAVAQINCNVQPAGRITATCALNKVAKSDTFAIGITGANGAECVSGTFTVNVTVKDTMVTSQNVPIGACRNGATDDQTSAVRSFTVIATDGCLPTQRVNPDVPYDAGQMGTSVSISNDWAVTVAPRDETKGADAGAAFVMKRTNSTWAIVQKLIPSTLAAGDQMSAAAIDGNTIVLGAPLAGNGNGAAWIFQYNGSSWVEVKTLSSPAAGSLFGRSVAVSGGNVAVGAPYYNGGAGTNSGGVFVYSGAGFSSATTLLPSGDILVKGEFGSSISLDGNLLAVGAPFPNSSTTRNEAVYLFNGATLQNKILSPDTANPNTRFGYSVALNGGNLLVGAPYSTNQRGTAYMFGASTGTKLPVTFNNGPGDGSHFGFTVAMNGSRIVIGAPDTTDPNPKVGGAYLYTTSGGNVKFRIRSQLPDRSEDSFAYSIGISADGYLISGALNDENTAVSNSGSVYFVKLP